MHFFSQLPAEARHRLRSVGEVVEVAEGEVFIRRGAMGGDIFMVEAGCLEVVEPRARPPVVLTRLGPGAVVGDLGFVDAAPRSADVRAREASRLLAWRRPVLRRVLESDPRLAAAFWAAMSEVAARRVRRLSDSVRAGRTPALDEAGLVDPTEVVDLAQGVRSAWARLEAPGPDDAPGEVLLLTALERVGQVLRRAGDADAAEALGAAARRALGELLASAPLARGLVDRGPGTPPPAAVVASLRGKGPPLPGPDGPGGLALDRSLRQLPTLAGVAALPEALIRSLTAAGAGERVGVLSLCADSLSLPGAVLLGTAAAAGQEGGGQEGGASQALALALGAAGDLPRGLDAAVVELVLEGLPDRLVVSLLARVRMALPPGGALVLAWAGPSDDDALLGQLLRWPMLRRGADTMGELVGAAGLSPRGALGGDDAGPWQVLVARRGRS